MPQKSVANISNPSHKLSFKSKKGITLDEYKKRKLAHTGTKNKSNKRVSFIPTTTKHVGHVKSTSKLSKLMSQLDLLRVPNYIPSNAIPGFDVNDPRTTYRPSLTLVPRLPQFPIFERRNSGFHQLEESFSDFVSENSPPNKIRLSLSERLAVEFGVATSKDIGRIVSN